MSDLEAKSHVGVLAKIKKDPAPAFGKYAILINQYLSADIFIFLN